LRKEKKDVEIIGIDTEAKQAKCREVVWIAEKGEYRDKIDPNTEQPIEEWIRYDPQIEKSLDAAFENGKIVSIKIMDDEIKEVYE
jgi:hypothetical protein